MNTLNKIGLICFLIGCLGLFFLIGYYGIYPAFGLIAVISYYLTILLILGGCIMCIN